MQTRPSLATVGTLIGQPARADMLLLLLDGRSRTATELADTAGVSRPTASHHLAQLVEGGLVRIDRQGRHRYFRLASQSVAELLESLLVVAETSSADTRRFGPRPTAMRQARMCYDHFAGELGVGLTDALLRSGVLIEVSDNFQLTEPGERQLADFGVDVVAARRRRRHFARACIDWSERRPHLAGALGAALAERIFEINWARREIDGRTVCLTPAGERGLASAFGVNLEATGDD